MPSIQSAKIPDGPALLLSHVSTAEPLLPRGRCDVGQGSQRSSCGSLWSLRRRLDGSHADDECAARHRLSGAPRAGELPFHVKHCTSDGSDAGSHSGLSTKIHQFVDGKGPPGDSDHPRATLRLAAIRAPQGATACVSRVLPSADRPDAPHGDKAYSSTRPRRPAPICARVGSGP